MDITTYIRTHSGFPKQHVVYHDFTPMLADPTALAAACDRIAQGFADLPVTHLAAIESKGFALGGALAIRLGLPLVLVRKPGLTPGPVLRQDFVKEYGQASYEIGSGRIGSGDTALIIYDILAGPGATSAAISLIEGSGAAVAGAAFVCELAALGGREALGGYRVLSLAVF